MKILYKSETNIKVASIMDKLIHQWNDWDISKRRKFLSNMTLSLFVIGLAAPIIIGMIAASFGSSMLMGLGVAVGVSIELIMIIVHIWKEWFLTL